MLAYKLKSHCCFAVAFLVNNNLKKVLYISFHIWDNQQIRILSAGSLEDVFNLYLDAFVILK